MIQIVQKIDDFIDDFEFEIYQGDAIKKVKFSNYEGKAVCKLEIWKRGNLV